MPGPELVAVQATEKRFRVLRHEPSGTAFDENGKAMWPADSFTWRLRDEGAIRIVEPEPPPSADAPPSSKKA